MPRSPKVGKPRCCHSQFALALIALKAGLSASGIRQVSDFAGTFRRQHQQDHDFNEVRML
jgi:hypothetical protein